MLCYEPESNQGFLRLFIQNYRFNTHNKVGRLLLNIAIKTAV